MDAIIEVFGDLRVATVIIIVAALIAIWKTYQKAKECIIDQYKNEEEKEERIQKVIEQAENYPKWHQQSLDIQKKFTQAISELKKGQEENNRRLEEIEKDSRKRERNRIRDRLLQSYRYYTSPEKNPKKQWLEMEAEAFWKMFKDYEDLGGNGYVHTEVQPTMNDLEVIPMHESEKLAELMHSRK